MCEVRIDIWKTTCSFPGTEGYDTQRFQIQAFKLNTGI